LRVANNAQNNALLRKNLSVAVVGRLIALPMLTQGGAHGSAYFMLRDGVQYKDLGVEHSPGT